MQGVARKCCALGYRVRYETSGSLIEVVPDALSLLYKVIDGRNRRSSTAIITNVNFDDWTEYLGDPPLMMALLDRVVDQTNLIPFEGESIRKLMKKGDK